ETASALGVVLVLNASHDHRETRSALGTSFAADAMPDMPLKTGILISGSLYWRNVPHRSRWREQFLHMERATAVKVPIRYGRLSRSNTYTMVYAPDTPPGQ